MLSPESRPSRSLQQENYVPATDGTVERAGALAKDFQLLEAVLALGTSEGRTQGRELYTNGAYCQSYATLTLTAPLQVNVPLGTVVSDLLGSTSSIQGVVHKAATIGDTTLEVQYLLPSDVPAATGVTQLCSVGGNPNPQLDQCFAVSGRVRLEGMSDVDYESYTASTDTQNGLSLASIGSTVTDSENKSYPTYRKFVDYYGAQDYANQWAFAAFDGTSTSFGNGNADFSLFQADGIDKAITAGSLTMNVWMHVLRTMGEAVLACRSSSSSSTPLAAAALWDDAVSFYQGIGGATDGSLDQLHHLAEEYCEHFGTCDSGVSMSTVNQNLYQYFNQGRDFLQNLSCDSAEALIDSIVGQMTVPLVQGLIFRTYELDIYMDAREVIQAEAATFAAALLPLIHDCSAGNADMIHINFQVGQGTSGSFEASKGALERQYACLGITCQDVGGIVDQTNPSEYLYNAEPCDYTRPPSADTPGQSSTSDTSDKDSGRVIGLAIGIPLLLLAFVVLLCCCRKMRKKDEVSAEADTTPGNDLEDVPVGSDGTEAKIV